MNVPNSLDPSQSDTNNIYTGLTGDSLAFTLVSVFTLTLMYVGVHLARRWRKKQQLSKQETTQFQVNI